MFPLQVFSLQLQLTDLIYLPLMVISVNVTVNLNHTAGRCVQYCSCPPSLCLELLVENCCELCAQFSDSDVNAAYKQVSSPVNILLHTTLAFKWLCCLMCSTDTTSDVEDATKSERRKRRWLWVKIGEFCRWSTLLLYLQKVTCYVTFWTFNGFSFYKPQWCVW